jgi:arabinofuranan 3-O-arabinosyltransferase
MTPRWLLSVVINRVAVRRLPLSRVVDVVRVARWATRERVMRWGIGFAVLSVVILGWHAASPSTARYMGLDYANYWAGARLAASGQASVAYDLAGFDSFEKALFGPAYPTNVYSYPPYHMLLTLPLATVPFVPGFILWNLLGLGLCAMFLSRLVGWQAAAIAAIGAPASVLSMMGGTTGQFAAALMGGCLVLLDRRPVLAGVLLGLVASKPQLGVLVPFALAASARWRTFAAASATVGILVAASLLVLGPNSWTGFLHQMDLQQQLMEVPGTYWARAQTVFLAVNYLGVGVTIAYAAQACATILMVIATIVVWRGRASLAVKSAVLVVAAFLATTYARDYDTVVLIFAAAWLAAEGRRTGFLSWERMTVLLLLVEPLVADTLTVLTGILFGPVLLSLALLVLLRRALAEAAGCVGAITPTTLRPRRMTV